MKNTLSRVCVFLIGVLLLGFCVSSASDAYPERGRRPEPRCEVRVQNDSCYEIYVMVDDRNEGKLYKNYSNTYKVERFGTIRVEASVGSYTARKSVDFRPDNQRAEVTFKTDDFPDMPKYKLP